MKSIFKSVITPFVLIGMALLSLPSFGQKPDVLMRLYFAEVRQGKFPAIPKQLSLSENSKSILDNVGEYLTDSVATVRSKAYTIVYLAGSNARQSHIREVAVQELIVGVNDANGGNGGTALDYLSSFQKEDFNTTSKDTLRSLFRRKAVHLEKIIKLIGFLSLLI